MQVLRNLIHTAAPFDHPTMDQARIDYCDLRRELTPTAPKRVAELAEPFLPDALKSGRFPPPDKDSADVEKPVKILAQNRYDLLHPSLSRCIGHLHIRRPNEPAPPV